MRVFVGTYTEPIRFGTGKILEGKGEGIYVYRLEPSSGALELRHIETGVTNPSYLAFDSTGHFLYAVNELKTYEGRPSGTVSAFKVDPKTARLQFLNKRLTHGTDPCHVAVNRKRTHAFVSNFMSGSVCVVPVQDDGSLGPASDFIQHQGSSIDPVRQQGPHAHSVTLDRTNHLAFVPDLGLNKLMIYAFDRKRGMLEPHRVPWIKMRPGAGPRHLALHPGGKFAYLINELDSTVVALAYDPRRGAFTELQTVSTLPGDYQGESTCAYVQVAPSGRFVYASNRGHDSIVIYEVERTGKLSCLGHQPTQGKTPRHFQIDPAGTFLLAANQDTDTIVVFRIDPRTGGPVPTGQVAHVPTPVCVKFLPSRG
ncbi:MAG TPA: lactonase family protein [Candidatus Sulfotelmatobacter sp.]|nr:lactonase family protein [Candidatus Sulfotelmatobacter sp.]